MLGIDSKRFMKFLKNTGSVIVLGVSCGLAGLAADNILVYVFGYSSTSTFWAGTVTTLLAIIWSSTKSKPND